MFDNGEHVRDDHFEFLVRESKELGTRRIYTCVYLLGPKRGEECERFEEQLIRVKNAKEIDLSEVSTEELEARLEALRRREVSLKGKSRGRNLKVDNGTVKLKGAKSGKSQKKEKVLAEDW